jgi:hypothetical protein
MPDSSVPPSCTNLDWGVVPRKYFLVDTFAGPVGEQFSANEEQLGRVAVIEGARASGAYVTDIGRVRRNFSEWPNAIVVQGVIPEVLPPIGTAQVAFLHIDVNCAYPERAAFRPFLETHVSRRRDPARRLRLPGPGIPEAIHGRGGPPLGGVHSGLAHRPGPHHPLSLGLDINVPESKESGLPLSLAWLGAPSAIAITSGNTLTLIV